MKTLTPRKPNQHALARTKAAEIKLAVAAEFGISVREIDSYAKPEKIALARHVAMWIVRRTIFLESSVPPYVRPLPFEHVAAIFNRKDHVSVTYAVSRIDALREQNADLLNRTNELLRRFRQHHPALSTTSSLQ